MPRREPSTIYVRDAQPRITSLRVRLSRNAPPLRARPRAQAPKQRNDSPTPQERRMLITGRVTISGAGDCRRSLVCLGSVMLQTLDVKFANATGTPQSAIAVPLRVAIPLRSKTLSIWRDAGCF